MPSILALAAFAGLPARSGQSKELTRGKSARGGISIGSQGDRHEDERNLGICQPEHYAQGLNRRQRNSGTNFSGFCNFTKESIMCKHGPAWAGPGI